MRRFFRRPRTPQPETGSAEAAHDEFAVLRDTILRTLQQDEPNLDGHTSLDRRPAWLRREWAERLSACTAQTITADDIARQRTACGLAHWLHRASLSDATLDKLRQQGF